MKKLIVSMAFLCLAWFGVKAQQPMASYDIIPQPQQVQLKGGSAFELNASTVIAYPDGNDLMRRNAEFLREYIQKHTGLKLGLTTNPPRMNCINLSLDPRMKTGEEGFTLVVDDRGVALMAAAENGIFYGIQTLRKSLPIVQQAQTVNLPAVQITDAPRFGYRGIHLDVARHFFDVDVVKQTIDMLALHNQNTFHWHLTDDQGWRVEIKRYPELTRFGSIRQRTVIGHNTPIYDNTPVGGFYTQEQMREVVEYAKERYITVIPEIDMPGHMLAVLACFPELGCTGGPYHVAEEWGIADDILCAGNEETFTFVENVLSELIEIFPSTYIHIGGDEAPRVRWQACEKCQARIRQLGLKKDEEHSAEDKLQTYFMARVEKFLNAKGRQIIGWEEIMEGDLSPTATVMSWRGAAAGIKAAKMGNDVIMSPASHAYLDYYQSENVSREPQAIGGFLPVEKVYSFDPMDQLNADQQKHIIGVQANLWTEYIPYQEQLQYMYMPRVAAISEVQWCQPANRSYDKFLKKLPKLVDLYQLLHWKYARHVLPADYVHQGSSQMQ